MTVSLSIDVVIVWILVGLVAGSLAGRVALGRDLGLLGDLVAGVLGGALGSRYHTRLERRVLKEQAETQEARTTFADLRQAMSEPTPPMTGVLTAPGDGMATSGEGLPAPS